MDNLEKQATKTNITKPQCVGHYILIIIIIQQRVRCMCKMLEKSERAIKERTNQRHKQHWVQNTE